MDNKLAKRVLAIASGGGHWVQLCRLYPAFEDSDVTYVTTLSGLRGPTIGSRTFIVVDASRNNPFKLFIAICQLLTILARIRPDVLVTTGAAPGLVALRVAKLFGVRTLWIDSIANGHELSLSGKLAMKHADLCLSQWPHVANRQPATKYRGAVI